MLTSLIIQLQASDEANLPASLGRAGQALLLRLIAERDAALAQQLHDDKGPKPYSASNLVLGKRQAGSLYLAAGQTGWLRFTGLTGPVSRQLQAVAAEPPKRVELDGVELRVTGATLDAAAHPWAGQISYQDLAAPYLLGGQAQPNPRVRLEFVSPTTFRRNEQYVPLPLPELVFGSLLDRWQAFAPIALPAEVRRFALEAVALSQYHLRTRSLPYKWGGAGQGSRGAEERGSGGAGEQGGDPATHFVSGRGAGENERKPGGMIFGFTGEVTFRALNRDRYWLNVLHLLAAFAFFSGVGYQTGAGLGQARVLVRR